MCVAAAAVRCTAKAACWSWGRRRRPRARCVLFQFKTHRVLLLELGRERRAHELAALGRGGREVRLRRRGGSERAVSWASPRARSRGCRSGGRPALCTIHQPARPWPARRHGDCNASVLIDVLRPAGARDAASTCARAWSAAGGRPRSSCSRAAACSSAQHTALQSEAPGHK